MNKKPRVLLTAPYGPNHLAWGEDQYDLLQSRLARGHGFFSMSSHCHYFALYLLAENINCPATVLENPHWDEFDRELDEGYDYVAMQIKSLHTEKIARMMKRVREKCPDTKIIIGGYGVSALSYPVPGDKNGDAVYIRENADYLCREEGVRFLRRIIGDEPVEREITQYQMPMAGFSPPAFDIHGRLPIVLVSLGCPNACDFCNTSAFFHHKKIRVAEPEEVYRYMKNYQKRLKSEGLITLLFDEDLFIDPEYVRELGRLIRSDKKTWGLQYFTFGSTRSMTKFTAEELMDCGLGAVWIGVESFLSDSGTTTDHYSKRSGDIKKLFADLHRHGIQTVASLVLGFDFHTPENLKDDIDQFVDLKPMFYQVSPLTPCPGTPLYERMVEDERILDNYKWEDFNLWKDDVFKLKNFEIGEIKEYYDYAHQQISDKLGPPAMQLMENMLDTYQTLKNKTSELHLHKAERARKRATGAYTLLHSLKRLHTSPEVRERALELQRRFQAEIGAAPLVIKAASRVLSNRIKKISKQQKQEKISDPLPRWTYYHTFGSGDEVHIMRGRKAKTPKPYKDRSMLARTFFR